MGIYLNPRNDIFSQASQKVSEKNFKLLMNKSILWYL